MMMRRRGVHVVRPLEGCDHKLSSGCFFSGSDLGW